MYKEEDGTAGVLTVVAKIHPKAGREGDIEALRDVEETARNASSGDGAPVDDAEVVNAGRAEETARSRYEKLIGDLRLAEGALHANDGKRAGPRPLRQTASAGWTAI